jgi:hypothetical protein
MADDEEEGPAVELGEGASVEGAPLARVASRLTWGVKRSAVVEREGDSVVRTPEGPRTLAAILEDVDVPYFERRQEFVETVRAEIGTGPIPTADEDTDDTEDAGVDDSEDADADDTEDADADDSEDADADDTEDADADDTEDADADDSEDADADDSEDADADDSEDADADDSEDD